MILAPRHCGAVYRHPGSLATAAETACFGLREIFRFEDVTGFGRGCIAASSILSVSRKLKPAAQVFRGITRGDSNGNAEPKPFGNDPSFHEFEQSLYEERQYGRGHRALQDDTVIVESNARKNRLAESAGTDETA